MDLDKKIQHLYARAGFGLTPKQFNQKLGSTLNDELKLLFGNARKESQKLLKQDALFTKMTSKKYSSLQKKERRKLIQKTGKFKVQLVRLDWFERMTDINMALTERMSFFWHSHFACYLGKPHFAISQLNIYRKYGLGSFRDLLNAVAKDVGMIFYLNNQQNKKTKPNENFARELLELFTLGTGNYSENDIKNATKAFTGWAGDFSGKFIFEEENHDFGPKNFMGKRGKFSGEDIIDLILENPKCAEFITRKVYRFFVNDEVNEEHVSILSKEFYDSDYNITRLMNKLFRSPWFYDEANVSTKIKSPIELLVDLSHCLDVEFDDNAILFFMKRLNQILFAPPNVAGWPSGKEWISNSSLISRLNLSRDIILKIDMNFDGEDGNDELPLEGAGTFEWSMDEITDYLNGCKKEEIVKLLSDYLRLNLSRELLYKVEAEIVEKSRDAYIRESLLKLTSLPEYQMC